LLSYLIFSTSFFCLGSGIATTILAPDLIAAVMPERASSKIIQFSGFKFKSFAAKINISGAGFPSFILLSSPVIILSISSFIHSF